MELIHRDTGSNAPFTAVVSKHDLFQFWERILSADVYTVFVSLLFCLESATGRKNCICIDRTIVRMWLLVSR